MSYYDRLKQIFHDAALSSDIAGILHWDMSTMMPKNSRENRADQLAYLSKVRHELISSKQVGDLINKAKDEQLDNDNKANLIEMEREYIMSSSLPSHLVEKLSIASATTCAAAVVVLTTTWFDTASTSKTKSFKAFEAIFLWASLS